MSIPPRRRAWLRRHAAWLGLGAGTLWGLSDVALVKLLGIEMRIGDTEVTWAVGVIFAVSLAAVGFLFGRLWQTRGKVSDQSKLIREQYDALRESQARVVQQEKLAALGRLTAGVAHEVRNPLGVIRSSAELLLEDMPPGSDASKAARFIVEEVARLNAFVTALLDYSRPIRPAGSLVDLRDCARDALVRLDSLLGDSEVIVEVSTPEALPVRGDGALLQQLIYGLVTNAIAALREERPPRPTITIRGAVEGDRCFLEVGDNGPGISPENASQVFEPFFTTRADGTGLGLAMAQRVAESHAGRLALAPSSPDGGACLRLMLPKADAETGALAQEASG